jgi:hypothetical protein
LRLVLLCFVVSVTVAPVSARDVVALVVPEAAATDSLDVDASPIADLVVAPATNAAGMALKQPRTGGPSLWALVPARGSAFVLGRRPGTPSDLPPVVDLPLRC